MTPTGALMLAVLAGAGIALAINWWFRRSSTTRHQYSRRTQLFAAATMLVLSAFFAVSMLVSSSLRLFDVVMCVAMGIAGAVHLVRTLRGSVVDTDG